MAEGSQFKIDLYWLLELALLLPHILLPLLASVLSLSLEWYLCHLIDTVYMYKVIILCCILND